MKLIIGNKYVPHNKSVATSLINSYCWEKAKELNQPYLYYTGLDGDYHCFGFEPGSGVSDYFLPSDVTPYYDAPELMQQALDKLKEIDIVKGMFESVDLPYMRKKSAELETEYNIIIDQLRIVLNEKV